MKTDQRTFSSTIPPETPNEYREGWLQPITLSKNEVNVYADDYGISIDVADDEYNRCWKPLTFGETESLITSLQTALRIAQDNDNAKT
jgi:hypothetical protein